MFRQSLHWTAFSLFVLAAPTAHAQWVLHGTAVVNAFQNKTEPVSVSDGAGGVIVAWVDNRSANNDVYAQRLNAQGVPQWTVDGVVICNAIQNQFRLDITTDGAGGAIIAWSDYRTPPHANADIYVQRINSAGAVQWTANGVIMVNEATDQFEPKLVADGAGGAVVCWTDPRSGSYDVYARKVNSAGAPQWVANGVALTAATGDQRLARIVSDGAGGAVVAWRDQRGATRDIYARRVDTAGVVSWTANGVAICTQVGNQEEQQLIPDGTGGAIIVWQDTRGGAADIYVQRVSGAGAVQWTPDGVPVTFEPAFQTVPAITTDGAGGAIIAWQDDRGANPSDIYVRRVAASGVPVWTANGVFLAGGASIQGVPLAVSDGAGGAIVAWRDARSGIGFDVYARRVSASGAPMWTSDGVPLSVMNDEQSVTTMVSNGSGGAIVSWLDFRSGYYDVFAQRVEPNFGYWGHPEPVVTSVADIGDDQGGKVKVNWTASGRDRVEPRTIGHYTIWRAVDVAMIGGLASTLTDIARTDTRKPGPVYATFATATEYYWELVGSQAAQALTAYTFSAPTRADSVLANTNNEVFMVMAHNEKDDLVAFASNAVAGHSVDNLAPLAPLALVAQRVGANVNLHWNRVRVPDLGNYTVYRKTSAGVTPVPPNFLSDSDDTLLVDMGAPATALYYIVTARDVHGNQSTPSNEANVSAPTGVGDTPALTTLTVLQNRPNPFTSVTDLQVGLPASSRIDVVVYDIAGRRVRALTIGNAPAGWKSIPFDGKDDRGNPLASGVYFYRVSALGKTITNKMVITR